MRRILIFSAVVAVAVAALWRHAARTVVAASNPGQVTMTFTYTDTASSSMNMTGMTEVSANSTVTLSETCTYKVLNYSDQGITLDDGQCTTNVSGSGNIESTVHTYDCKQVGAGKVACPPIAKKDSATCGPRPANGQMTRLSLDPVAGTGEISFQTPRLTVTSSSGENVTTECVAMPGNLIDSQPGDTREVTMAKMDKYNKDLAAAQQFKFNPNDSSFSGGNSFSRSWSSGGTDKLGSVHSSGSLKFQYTVSGGAPKDATEVELIPPEGYQYWLPQAGENEKEPGNLMLVGIVAHKKDDPDSPPPKKVLKYTITLEDTSKEKGVDLNWPSSATGNGPTADFDFRIDNLSLNYKLTDDKGQAAATIEEGLTEFWVQLTSYDWGGWTHLKVVAELSDHSTVVAHVRGLPQQTLAVPKDDDGNHIADAWEQQHNVSNLDPASDEDALPSNGSTGDGIALYDEYRGFHVGGDHTRLSPNFKDLFVRDFDKLGAGNYQAATDIHVRVLQDNEAADNKESAAAGGSPLYATPNGRYGKVPVIPLRNKNIGDGGVGSTEPQHGLPATIQEVQIDAAVIAAGYKTDALKQRQATIAHELGHATNVKHHDGDSLIDYNVGDVICKNTVKQPDGSVKYTGDISNFLCSDEPEKGSAKIPGPKDKADCWGVAVKGGMFSGNDQCPMRYDMTSLYEDPNGACTVLHGRGKMLSKFGRDPPPQGKFCRSPQGTGVNADSNPHNKAGDATMGVCYFQVRLK
jgi:hypothetical protein